MPDNPFEPIIKNIGNYVSGTLYAQGVIPPIGIDNYEGLALSSPADTHLLAAKDPVIDEIAVGMTGNEIKGEYVTGTPPLTLSDSEGYPLQWWQVTLSPSQDLHGHANPWPAGGGVNKLKQDFEIGGISSQTGGDVAQINTLRVVGYSRVTAEDSYYLKGTAYLFYYADADNSTYNGNSGGYVSNTVVTIPAGSNYVRIQLPNSYGTTYNYDVALNNPSSITSWTPYENICSILGTDKLNMFAEESYDQTATPKAIITLPETIYSGHVYAGGAVSMMAYAEFDGSIDEEWRDYSGRNGFYINMPLMNNGRRQAGYANYLIVDIPGYAPENGVWFGASNTNMYVINVDGLLQVHSVDEWRAYLAEHPLQVVYPLSTPTILTLSTPSIPTPKGNATTWVTAEDGVVDSMEVTYIKTE